jgi:hypothetical protein
MTPSEIAAIAERLRAANEERRANEWADAQIAFDDHAALKAGGGL